MAGTTYEITAPDGRVFVVDGPEGGTKEQALAQVQAQYQTKTATTGAAPPLKIGAEGFPDAMKEVASRGFSKTDQFLGGAGSALDQMAMRLKQAVVGLTPQDEENVKQQRALAGATGSTLLGNITGNVAATASPAVGLQAGATNLAARALPAAAAVPAGAAATGAAVAAATNPVLKGESEAINAGLGAAGNVLGTYAAKGLSHLAQPIQDVSKATLDMVKRGFAVTPGQAGGATSILGKIEQQLQSVGVFGWLIDKARASGVKDMNVGAIKSVVPEGTEKEIAKAGRDSVARAGDLIDSAYDRAYAAIKNPVRTDVEFRDAVQAIPMKERIDLPPDLAKRFEQMMGLRVYPRMSEGASAETVRAVQNSLGELSRRYKASGSPDERSLGQAFAEAKVAFREMVSRQGSPEFRKSLEALDGKYRDLLAIEKASGFAGSKEGVFSADSLSRATKTATPAMKQFAQSARDVYGATVPDSGTAGRISLQALPYMLGGAGVANQQMGGPETLTALGLMSLLASPAVGKYAYGGFPGQQATAATLNSAAPLSGQVGRSALQQIYESTRGR